MRNGAVYAACPDRGSLPLSCFCADANPRVLARYAGTEPIQLAIDGSPFWPVLEDLAEDDSVNGTVIVDVTVWKIGPGKSRSIASEWLRYYRQYGGKRPTAPYYWDFESDLRTVFSGHLAYRSIGITPQSMFGRWLEGASPPRNYLKMLPDRSVMADFRKTNKARLYRMRVEAHKGQVPVAFQQIHDFDDRLAALERLVRKIQARGGRVVLIYLPRSGEIKRIEDIRFPRAVYWDQLARTTSAETLHFEDVPALAHYDLPDGSHLDYRQAISFTETLGRILFPPRSSGPAPMRRIE